MLHNIRSWVRFPSPAPETLMKFFLPLRQAFDARLRNKSDIHLQIKIALINEREKQVRYFVFASRDPGTASLRARSRVSYPSADRREPAARWPRARAAALLFSLLRACAECGGGFPPPKQISCAHIVSPPPPF